MQNIFEALASKRRNSTIPEEFNYYGKLFGSWIINYIENDNSLAIKGE